MPDASDGQDPLEDPFAWMGPPPSAPASRRGAASSSSAAATEADVFDLFGPAQSSPAQGTPATARTAQCSAAPTTAAAQADPFGFLEEAVSAQPPATPRVSIPGSARQPQRQPHAGEDAKALRWSSASTSISHSQQWQNPLVTGSSNLPSVGHSLRSMPAAVMSAFHPSGQQRPPRPGHDHPHRPTAHASPAPSPALSAELVTPGSRESSLSLLYEDARSQGFTPDTGGSLLDFETPLGSPMSPVRGKDLWRPTPSPLQADGSATAQSGGDGQSVGWTGGFQPVLENTISAACGMG
jgi:hypothetical protein